MNKKKNKIVLINFGFNSYVNLANYALRNGSKMEFIYCRS